MSAAVCPNCKNEVAADAAYCGVCYEVLRKPQAAEKAAQTPAAAAPKAAPARPPLPWAVPLALSFPLAAFFAWNFADYLPITDVWMRVARMYPFGLANFLFHEGGHWIFYAVFFGNQFMNVLGGSAMQLLIPLACLVNFYVQESVAGMLLCVAWVGQNLIDVAFYVADAKQQVLILITGTSGSEGSFHDWRFLLDVFGLTRHAVGLGQCVFFVGCWLGLWPFFIAAALALRRLLGDTPR